MLEKILEKKLKRETSVPSLQKRITRRLTLLKKQFDHEKYGVKYRWDRQKKKLLMKSKYFAGEIALSSNKISVWADVPFLFRPFKGRVVAELSRGVDELLKD